MYKSNDGRFWGLFVLDESHYDGIGAVVEVCGIDLINHAVVNAIVALLSDSNDTDRGLI